MLQAAARVWQPLVLRNPKPRVFALEFFESTRQMVAESHFGFVSLETIIVMAHRLLTRAGMLLMVQTRAVFMDLTLYNPETRLFLVLRFAWELPPGGHIIPTVSKKLIKLWRNLSSAGAAITI